MKSVFAFILYCTISFPLFAQKVHPAINIINEKCASCHKANEAVPFELNNVGDVIKHQKMMAYVIENQIMPPWFTDTNYRSHRNQLSLRETERNLLLNWLKNEITDHPNTAIIPLKKPDEKKVDERKADLVISMNKPYYRKASETDEFTWFHAPFKQKDTLTIQSIKLKSTNHSTLHHCELFSNTWQDLPPSLSSFPTDKPQIETAIPFTENGISFYNDKKFVAGRFSNLPIQRYPKGICNQITPDRYFIYYTHFSPSPIDEKDSSWIELSFTKEKSDRAFVEYGIHAFQNLVNKPFVLEPEDVKTFYCEKELDTSISVFSMLPHAHHLCKDMLVFAVTPKNDTIHLLKIDKWVFEWQWVYEFDSFVVLPKGTNIHFSATYDNRSINPANPFHPAKTIQLSLNANDEMMTVFLQAVIYKKGDEKKKLIYQE